MTPGAAAVHTAPVTDVDVRAFEVPTSTPQQQDGTQTWSSTTVVVVEVHAGGPTGLGWTYGPTACGEVVRAELADVLDGRDATDVRARWLDMVDALRNAGRPGIGAMAVSAVDIAFLDAAALARANHVELSTHCAPALSAHVCCAAPAIRHAEWFHDHAWLEPMLFDGVPDVDDGVLRPDRSRSGHGLALRDDIDRFAVC